MKTYLVNPNSYSIFRKYIHVGLWSFSPKGFFFWIAIFLFSTLTSMHILREGGGGKSGLKKYHAKSFLIYKKFEIIPRFKEF